MAAQAAPAFPGAEQIVLEALEDRRYQWRTVAGIAAQLGVAAGDVEQILARIPVLIESTRCGPKGQRLFSTRNHYRRSHTFGERLLNAITDRLD